MVREQSFYGIDRVEYERVMCLQAEYTIGIIPTESHNRRLRRLFLRV